MFTQEVWNFFDELKENNHKDWFHANRKTYDLLREQYLNNADILLKEMCKHDVSLSYLQPKDIIFRINRDIRFSKDKSPYKTHLAYGLNPHGKKMAFAGYYLHLEKDNCFIGGGMYMPDSASLKKVRNEINFFVNDFKEILEEKKFKKTFGGLDTDENVVLKTTPKGYDTDNPAIEYLKFKSFTAIKKFDNSLLTDKKALEKTIEIFVTLKPLIDFLNRALVTEDTSDIEL